MKQPKVALVHDYLVQYGGAEKTLEAIAELFPEAPIYTGIYKPQMLSDFLNKRKIIHSNSSILGKFPKYLTFLMPLVFENFDLTEYDLVISDGTSWAKGVLTSPDQKHISYVHTPPRFLYKYSVETQKRNKWYFKPFVAFIDNVLRVWDFSAAQRPDVLIANSEETKKRIKKFYGRDAKVIYPPVELNTKSTKTEKDNITPPFYLALGRLAAYKNTDLMIQAFNLLGLPLTVIGTGTEEGKLRKMAKENITFLGQGSEEIKAEKLSQCLGVIFPVKDEDFGIVPIEAMSYGKPVLAHRSGGVLETVREGIDGMFFDKLDLETLTTKIKEFDENIRKQVYKPELIKPHVQMFSKDRFKKEFYDFTQEILNK
jgi:glycosyltransferase involved in cell wall biosynthesis